MAKTLDNVQQLTDLAAGHAKDIDSILDDTAATMHDLRETLAEAKQTVANLNQLMGDRGEVRGTLKSVDDLTHRSTS